MSPQPSEPEGDVAKLVADAFGGVDGFRERFKKSGTGQFGSGWVWLVLRAGKMEVLSTSNANLPLTMEGVTPLLTCDVWEHAYYLDYQNKRGDFLDAFLDHLIDWHAVERRLG
jgi:Fe-Mn family superoxide dismutase